MDAADLARIAREQVASLGAELVAGRTLPAHPGDFATLPDDLPEALRDATRQLGIDRLYRHQREAWQVARSGRDLLLTTGTASGKSLGYQLPVIASQLEAAQATALMLFPTKALAYDQADSFERLASAAGLAPGTVASYDGDTPPSQRPGVRARVRTLVTNPDMLHAGILPHHTLWARFLGGLQFLIVDELHVYRGVFGGHLAGVVRRLLRIAAHYGATPRLITTSATLGNPEEHAWRVLGREVVTIGDDAAPHAQREVLLIRPPYLDQALGLRRAALAEAASLAERLSLDGLQVLVFAGSRQGAEEAVMQLRARVAGVRSYRSGLLASERRAIERELREGSARVVVATNALELGIDIGGVDAVVIAGYPCSAAAFWQQIGRAGRRGRPGVGVLVLNAGPLDQYLALHPGHLFGAPPERALTVFLDLFFPEPYALYPGSWHEFTLPRRRQSN